MQFSPENEKPHIYSIEEGLQGVSVIADFQTVKSLQQFIQPLQLIGVGSASMAFKLPENAGNNLFLLNYMNVAGYEFTSKLIEDLTKKQPECQPELESLLALFAGNPELYKYDVRRYAQNRIFERIAAHNSAFRRDPSITVPIEYYYTFQGNPLGIMIEQIEGEPLPPDQEMTPIEKFLLRDDNRKNVRVNAEDGSRKLIDLDRFTPSNLEP